MIFIAGMTPNMHQATAGSTEYLICHNIFLQQASQCDERQQATNVVLTQYDANLYCVLINKSCAPNSLRLMYRVIPFHVTEIVLFI